MNGRSRCYGTRYWLRYFKGHWRVDICISSYSYLISIIGFKTQVEAVSAFEFIWSSSGYILKLIISISS